MEMGDAGEMQGRCSGGAGEMQCRCRGDLVAMQWRDAPPLPDARLRARSDGRGARAAVVRHLRRRREEMRGRSRGGRGGGCERDRGEIEGRSSHHEDRHVVAPPLEGCKAAVAQRRPHARSLTSSTSATSPTTRIDLSPADDVSAATIPVATAPGAAPLLVLGQRLIPKHVPSITTAQVDPMHGAHSALQPAQVLIRWRCGRDPAEMRRDAAEVRR